MGHRRIWLGIGVGAAVLTVGLSAQSPCDWGFVICDHAHDIGVTLAPVNGPPIPEPPTDQHPMSPTAFSVRPMPVVPSAQWTTICETTGILSTAKSSCPASTISARGFLWGRVPFDDVNNEFLVYMAVGTTNGSIYSDDIIGISVRTNAITPRVQQNVLTQDDGCWAKGGNATMRNPPVGHPRGMTWFDSIVKKWFNTTPLCVGWSTPQTGVYNAQTRAMEPLRDHWLLEPSKNGFAWESGVEFIPSYNKAVFCCGDQQSSTVMSEFSASTGTYTNISAQVRGIDGVSCDVNLAAPKPISSHCPIQMFGATVLTDGANLWIFGGTNNSFTLSNDLYKYNPTTKQIAKIQPTGGVKPPNVDTGFPLAFMDTKRNRIVLLAKTNEIWQYSLATNTWASFSAGGQSTQTDELRVLPDYFANAYAAGRMAGYDQGADAALFIQSRGQNAAPDIRKLQFSGDGQ